MKARKLRRLLETELGYRAVRRPGGSHEKLKSAGRPTIIWAFHTTEVGPHLVRDILVKQAGLTVEEALEVVGRA